MALTGATGAVGATGPVARPVPTGPTGPPRVRTEPRPGRNQGPVGPKADRSTGSAGTNVVNVTTVSNSSAASSANKSITATCTGGRKIVGGGALIGGDTQDQVGITASYPSSATVWTATGIELDTDTHELDDHRVRALRSVNERSDATSTDEAALRGRLCRGRWSTQLSAPGSIGA